MISSSFHRVLRVFAKPQSAQMHSSSRRQCSPDRMEGCDFLLHTPDREPFAAWASTVEEARRSFRKSQFHFGRIGRKRHSRFIRNNHLRFGRYKISNDIKAWPIEKIGSRLHIRHSLSSRANARQKTRVGRERRIRSVYCVVGGRVISCSLNEMRIPWADGSWNS